MLFSFVFENGTVNTNLSFIYGLVTGVAIAGLTQFLQYIVQSRLQRQQLDRVSADLNRQLEQSERNLMLQLLHQDQKRAIEELWSIIHSDVKNYSKMRERLSAFLDSVTGYYLPSDIQTTIRREIYDADRFLDKLAVEIGVAPPMEFDERDYEEWYKSLPPEELLALGESETYNRFKFQLKGKLRKIMSGEIDRGN